MCLVQGYNVVPLVRLKPATSRTQVKQYTLRHCDPIFAINFEETIVFEENDNEC